MNHPESDPLDTTRPTDYPATPDLGEPEADELDAGIGEFVARSRARLVGGGPEVDHLAVIDFVGCELPAGEDERVRGLVTTYRAWHDAFWLHYAPLARQQANADDSGAVTPPDRATEGIKTGQDAPASRHPHPSRPWLLGLVRGLVESECPDESVQRTLAESLDEYPGRGRPADDAVDLWDVLFGTTGDETRTDPVTARDDRPGRADVVPTTVTFARHLLRVTADRLARTRGFGEESLTVIAARRLAGWSVAEIALELGEAPEIVRVGLGIIQEQWTAAGGTPAATT